MSIVGDYWFGVLQRLEAEVAVFAALIEHEGEKGRENETALARMLSGLVPDRYGVGSGLLIDTADKYSQQTDIVLFEQADEPRLFAQTSQVLFPIENVVACIEVKTTLRGPDIDDCREKAKTLRAMSPRRKYGDDSTHPLFVVFAYRGGQSPQTIARKFYEAPREERPDLLCVVEHGQLAGNPEFLGSHAAPRVGLALLRDDEGRSIVGTPTESGGRGTHNGRVYPLVPRTSGGFVFAEPARALLLFTEVLLRAMAEKQGRSKPMLSHYVTSELRELDWIDRSEV